jgi:hypothetical protein
MKRQCHLEVNHLSLNRIKGLLMIPSNNKKVTLNGIEMALSEYEYATPIFFDCLERFIADLEGKLGNDDENFQLSINLDFSTSQPPKYEILSNGSPPREIKERINGILEQSIDGENSSILGSVKIDLQVENR